MIQKRALLSVSDKAGLVDFARQLREMLSVPVGIIETSWGGKPIEGFIPRSQLEKHETLRPILALAEQNQLLPKQKFHPGIAAP